MPTNGSANLKLIRRIHWVLSDRNPVRQTKDKDTNTKDPTTKDSQLQGHFQNLSGTQREPKDTISATKSCKHNNGNVSQESQQPS